MPDRARRARPYEGGWIVIRPDWRTTLRRTDGRPRRPESENPSAGRRFEADASDEQGVDTSLEADASDDSHENTSVQADTSDDSHTDTNRGPDPDGEAGHESGGGGEPERHVRREDRQDMPVRRASHAAAAAVTRASAWVRAGGRRVAEIDWRERILSDPRPALRESAVRSRAWVAEHRVLVAGVAVVALFAAADGVAPRPVSDSPAPGSAQLVPVAYPLQVRASAESSKRYLNAINNGERLREAQVVAAAARATLDRAKAEAAAAIAGTPQPWLSGPATSLPGGVPPGAILPGGGGFALPAIGMFTSGYGQRWGTFHYGIDIAAPIGSPIYAVTDGTVIDAGPAQGFGLWVRIRHDDGSITVYGHMYDFSVSVGERVRAGQQIARVGNRGDSTGPHLHFEVLINGQHVDPQPWLAVHGIRVG
ncbi:M23 family metallopeptidase [Nocardia sp. NPDC004068]|uniref:M23 family metallopeptidase n=1 Tax=Nocardia sp. NPDC004068 TaxID=3364303 RepID=UPI00367AB6C5